MRMLVIVLLAALMCRGLPANAGPNERFIQGEWRAAGEHPGEEGAGSAWLMEWKFESGHFKQSGYPPLEQRGKYKVVEEGGSLIELHLFDQEGTFGADQRRVKVKIDRETDTIEIDGIAGFSRKSGSG